MRPSSHACGVESRSDVLFRSEKQNREAGSRTLSGFERSEKST